MASYFPAQKSVAVCESVLVPGEQRFVQERTSRDMSRESSAASFELPGSNHSQLLDKRFRLTYLNNMKGKEALITEIEQASQSMIQGSLTELTRKCGDPSCDCLDAVEVVAAQGEKATPHHNRKGPQE